MEGCWGTENEHTAFLRYHEYKQKNNEPVEICYVCDLVVNPKWAWLGSSSDALFSDAKEKGEMSSIQSTYQYYRSL